MIRFFSSYCCVCCQFLLMQPHEVVAVVGRIDAVGRMMFFFILLFDCIRLLTLVGIVPMGLRYVIV